MSSHWLRAGLQEPKSTQVCAPKTGWITLTFTRFHKTYRHQSQQLHENGDGTFSIAKEDTLGMEKEKPYKCEVCGKRYKNLNGLKYVSSSALTFFIELLTSVQHEKHNVQHKKLILAAASEAENSEAIGLMNS